MEQLEGTGFDLPLQRKRLPARRAADKPIPPLPARTWRWLGAGAALVAASTAVYFGAAPALSWLVDVPADARALPQTAPEPLPIVRTADTVLDRARDLYAGGHLRDALRLLDGIGIADPARSEADRLRADIQRVLLASVNTGPDAPAPTGTAR
jgi:alkyl sulfatase BDS1-like metallo-beta-lactamase superfamily hydrolase